MMVSPPVASTGNALLIVFYSEPAMPMYSRIFSAFMEAWAQDVC